LPGDFGSYRGCIVKEVTAQDNITHRKCLGISLTLRLSLYQISFVPLLEPLEPLILPPQGSIISDDHKRVTAGVGSKIDALKGATITITCEVKGVPKPKVSWTKDGRNISPDERLVLGSKGTLIIRDSTLDDSGNYTCTASSRTGQTSSTSPVAVSGKVVAV